FSISLWLLLSYNLVGILSAYSTVVSRCSFFSCIILPPPFSTLFPYTTLFRSCVPPNVRRTPAPDPEPQPRGPPFRRPLDQMAYIDRKSTRLNSSHQIISYAVFCLKKKNGPHNTARK